MTRRSFVGAGVLFFVLLVPRPSHADPIIFGWPDHKGWNSSGRHPFSSPAPKTSASQASSLRSDASLSYHVGSTVYPDRRFNSVVTPAAQMFLERSPWGQRSSNSGGIGVGSGSMHLVFQGMAVLPPVVESLGLVSVPCSLAGQWSFPFISLLRPRPGFGFSGSGMVTASLAPSFTYRGDGV